MTALSETRLPTRPIADAEPSLQAVKHLLANTRTYLETSNPATGYAARSPGQCHRPSRESVISSTATKADVAVVEAIQVPKSSRGGQLWRYRYGRSPLQPPRSQQPGELRRSAHLRNCGE